MSITVEGQTSRDGDAVRYWDRCGSIMGQVQGAELSSKWFEGALI
jgi:hypothetical protein